jgi:hypothetical protein
LLSTNGECGENKDDNDTSRENPEVHARVAYSGNSIDVTEF